MEIKNIYNGVISINTSNYKFKEFKIVSNKKIQKFKKVNYHCAWFYYDNNCNIIGPITLDLELIKEGKRIVDDLDFPEFHKKEIKNVMKHDILLAIPDKILNTIYDHII